MDGGQPYAGLIRDAAGNLYGTTYYGGVNCQYFILPTFPPCGVVFKLDTSGKETVLYQFQLGDGANSIASLIRDKAGNLYGTNYTGGSATVRHKTACSAAARSSKCRQTEHRLCSTISRARMELSRQQP